jgi:hypothetical protein
MDCFASLAMTMVEAVVLRAFLLSNDPIINNNIRAAIATPAGTSEELHACAA